MRTRVYFGPWSYISIFCQLNIGSTSFFLHCKFNANYELSNISHSISNFLSVAWRQNPVGSGDYSKPTQICVENIEHYIELIRMCLFKLINILNLGSVLFYSHIIKVKLIICGETHPSIPPERDRSISMQNNANFPASLLLQLWNNTKDFINNLY